MEKKLITNQKKQHVKSSRKEQISSEIPDQIKKIMKMCQRKETVFDVTNKQTFLLNIDVFASIQI